MPAALPSAAAEALYEDLVWPALWDVLLLQSPSASSPRTSVDAKRNEHAPQLRHSRALQHAVTHALLRLIGSATPRTSPAVVAHKTTVNTLEAVASQLLLHTRGAPITKPRNAISEDQRGILGSAVSSLFTPAAALAAVEVERLFVLVCTALQLSAQTDVPLLCSDRVPALDASGAAAAASTTAAAAAAVSAAPMQLSFGAAVASKAVVAGIFGVARHVGAASAEQHIQPFWFAFLFFYLQQVSAHTPKDTSLYARFFDECAKERAKRIASDPISSDDDTAVAEPTDNDSGCGSCQHKDAYSNELAALRAWSQVSPDLLKDTIARTRFRRAALLFKSFVPHMTTQAPTLMFLLIDLLCEYGRSWDAYMHNVPAGELDGRLAEQLTQYGTHSIADDDSAAVITASCASSPRSEHQRQWQRCRGLIQSYGERLSLLLGEGTPHAHLVATAICAALSSLYIIPHTRPTGVSAGDVSVLYSNSSSSASAPSSAAMKSVQSSGSTSTGAAGAAHSRRDEEAAVQEVERAYRLPRRRTSSGFPATEVATSATAVAASTGSLFDADFHSEVCTSEAEWQLRHYAPFGQLLAYVRIGELQKVHLFSVAATQMRVGRTAAQQTEHVQLFALTSLYCGVAGWDLALLLYHFAECPLNPYVSAAASPAPALPISALARYTAAVHQYVDQTRAELIVNTPFVEMDQAGFAGGFGGDRRRMRGHGDGMVGRMASMSSSQPTIPSRGELQTPRFIKMVHPDPILLSWRAHVAAVEMTLAPTATQISSPPPSSSPSTVGSSTPASLAVAAGGPDALLSPCCLVRDLLIAGQYTLASTCIRYLADNPFGTVNSDGGAPAISLNVFLPPRRVFPRSISVVYYVSVLVRRWMQRWDALQGQQASRSDAGAHRLREEMIAVLRSLFPLLSVAQSYLAHQTLLTRLVSHLAWLCKSTAGATGSDDVESKNAVFGLAEQYLIYVVMPCLRVLPPALVVYDTIDDVLDVFARFSHPNPSTHAVVPYGDSPAAPLHVMAWVEALLPSPAFVSMYRTEQQQLAHKSSLGGTTARPPQTLIHPHDALARKEREALLSHSLKRLNAENIEEYQAALRPILYAEPLLVAHRLFVQAIGYNNNFLNVHTHLLHGLPRTILMLIVQQGLLLMARYATEEKVTDTNSESRTAILATFLATLWRDNVDSLDGTMLVRRVELALRSDNGSEILLGTELCKALLAVMAYRTLEHSEKYSAAQMQALATTPSTTSLFGRGAVTSFRMRFWQDAGSPLLRLSPTDVFVRARRALADALQQPSAVPLQMEDEEAEEEDNAEAAANARTSGEETRLTLGQLILVHLCRLQSRIYELQRDLDGGAERILLASAERFNTINDMLVVIEELSAAPRVSSVIDRICALVRQAALPQVALYIETQQRRKFEAIGGVAARTPSLLAASDAVYQVPISTLAPTTATTTTAAGGVGPSVARLLQLFTAAHFDYSPTPYDAARLEWKQCMQRAQALLATHRGTTAVGSSAVLAGTRSSRADAQRAAAIMAWLKTEETRMEAEEVAHKRLVQSSGPARTTLFEAFLRDLVPADRQDAACVDAADDRLIDFAASYLLPRAVLNLREAATVAAFFVWAFQQAEARDASAPSTTPQSVLVRRVTDLALAFVSALFTYFVALTDGECKRIGYVLQRLLEVPALSSQQQLLGSVAALPPDLRARLQPLLSPPKPGELKESGATAADGKTATVATAAAAAARGSSRASNGRHNGDAGSSGKGEGDTISSALFSRVFLGLCVEAPGMYSRSASTSSAPTAALSPPLPPTPLPPSQLPSMLSLAVARGLVTPVQRKAAATSPSLHKEEETQQKKHERSALAKRSAASQPALVLSAIPLQFEAYLCQALVQLLTHEDDVPSYAQRNHFLILEQLDKMAFPATLCAADVLIRAMEPHASKSKSYYALASAVLRALRASRRSRREAHSAVVALSRGEGVEAVSPAATGAAAATEALKESAAACYAQWRLREHYMKQLLQSEVALLLSTAQAHRPDEGDEEEEEKEAEEDDEAKTNDKGDGEASPEGDQREEPHLSQQSDEGDEEGSEGEGSEGEISGSDMDAEESYSGNSSGTHSDDEGDEEEEGDDGETSDVSGGQRKRPRAD